MLLRILLSLIFVAAAFGGVHAQDGEEAPRSSSPFMLPSGNAPSDNSPYPDTGVPAPSFERLPAADHAPGEEPAAYPMPQVDSHPLPKPPRPEAPRGQFQPMPGGWGELPGEPRPIAEEKQTLPIPMPPAEEAHAYYEQSPGNKPVAMDVQQAGATLTEPLVSIPAAAVSQSEPLKLAPPSKQDRELKPVNVASNSQVAVTVVASLAAVIGLFLLVAWGTKKALPGTTGRLPPEVLEPLGRLPVTAKTELQLLRLGSKLILVSSNSGAMDTVCEVTDPLEVERLLAMCRKQKPNSSTAAFRETLNQVGAEPARGFAGEFARANPGAARRG